MGGESVGRGPAHGADRPETAGRLADRLFGRDSVWAQYGHSPRGTRRRYDRAMTVTIQLPADLSAALGARWDDVPRRSLEAIAIEGYRTGALSEEQVRRVLGLETRFHVHAMLKAHQVPLHYTSADLDDDLAAHRALGILPSR